MFYFERKANEILKNSLLRFQDDDRYMDFVNMNEELKSKLAGTDNKIVNIFVKKLGDVIFKNDILFFDVVENELVDIYRAIERIENDSDDKLHQLMMYKNQFTPSHVSIREDCFAMPIEKN